jgi:hypothetical protein
MGRCAVIMSVYQAGLVPFNAKRKNNELISISYTHLCNMSFGIQIPDILHDGI